MGQPEPGTDDLWLDSRTYVSVPFSLPTVSGLTGSQDRAAKAPGLQFGCQRRVPSRVGVVCQGIQLGAFLPTDCDTPSSGLCTTQDVPCSHIQRTHPPHPQGTHCPPSQLPQSLFTFPACPFLSLAHCPTLPQPGTPTCPRPPSAGDVSIKAETCLPSPSLQVSCIPVAPRCP